MNLGFGCQTQKSRSPCVGIGYFALEFWTLDQEGFYHPAVKKPDDKVLVEQPSLSDHSESQKALKVQLVDVERRIQQYEEKLEMGIHRASAHQLLKSTQKSRADYDLAYEDVEAVFRNWGDFHLYLFPSIKAEWAAIRAGS